MKKLKHKSVLDQLLQFLILTIFILLPLGQLQRLQITPTISTYSHEIIIAITVFIWGLRHLIFKQPRVKPFFEKRLLLFSAIVGVSFLLNLSQIGAKSTVGLFHLVRLLVYFGFLLLLYDLNHRRLLPLPLQIMLLISGFSLAIFAWIQYLFIPDTRFLYYLGWDDHLYRAIGTLFDPGFLGLLLVLTLILLEERINSLLAKLTYLAVFAIMLLTYARSAYLAFVVASVASLVKTKSVKPFIVKIALIFLAIPLLPRPAGEGVKLERTYSIYARTETSLSAVDVWKTTPLLGVGYNNYRAASQVEFDSYLSNRPIHPSGPDNSFLLILATTGIIGLVIYLFFLGSITLQASAQNHIVFTSLITIFIHSLTNNSLFYPWVITWMGGLISQLNSHGE